MIIKTRDKNGPTGATLPTVNQGYYLSISGGDRVSITDESGITNTPIGDAGFELGVPGVSFAGGIYEGEGSYQEIAMPADEGAYTIKFRTGTDSIDIEILKGVGNTSPNLAIRYIDLELPADVECLLTFDPQGVPDLRYDSNGDGTYDVVVPAHVRVSGAAAQDVTAPAVGFAKDSATGLVSIDATDSESGVGTIYYRYAGDASFQIYTAPFVPTANSLEAFADDNVGNRSSPVTASLVSISGRVMDSSGRPISGAFVTLTDPQGGARTFRTNTFGYYRFDDVLTGQSYELAVSSRRYTFEPRSVALTGELTGFDFTANP
ncbi:MAG: carboxypeptidase-like regulatory domain-containing protein [Pyrinomonadaceae bacterium]